jgi:xanthine/CO dehydrogenase XdhC/CoxF family maturation factor
LKHWQETREIVRRVVDLGRDGRTCAVATVTRIEGSAYRRPGAKLLIESDGSVCGGVSGGCLEEDVREVGLRVLRSGAARLQHYATGSDESRVWGLGLGCDGNIEILVQPVSSEAACGPWAEVQELLEGNSPFALATLFTPAAGGALLAVGPRGRIAGGLGDPDVDAEAEAQGMAAIRSGRAPFWRLAGSSMVFTEVLAPPLKLVVCGAGEDAKPLVAFAAAAGFRVCVADSRAAYVTAQRFPDAWKLLPVHPEADAEEMPGDAQTYAVVMTHSLERDTMWVRRLLEADVPYVGLLGPRARTRKLLHEIGTSGSERVFGPVGLDLGAEGAEQVALSIVAELLAVRSGRDPRHLRERQAAVHAEA